MPLLYVYVCVMLYVCMLCSFLRNKVQIYSRISHMRKKYFTPKIFLITMVKKLSKRRGRFRPACLFSINCIICLKTHNKYTCTVADKKNAPPQSLEIRHHFENARSQRILTRFHFSFFSLKGHDVGFRVFAILLTLAPLKVHEATHILAF